MTALMHACAKGAFDCVRLLHVRYLFPVIPLLSVTRPHDSALILV